MLLSALASPAQAEEAPAVRFEKSADTLEIAIGGRPFATYVLRDERTPRPHFRHLHAPSGIQITRNHPPVPGRDLDDHPTFHPGLWLAFGDLDGADFWRNQAAVRHVGYINEPVGGAGQGSFTVRNAYESGGQTLCTEECGIEIRVRPAGTLLIWTSTFRSDERDFAFGDQEEMGLGVRMATPLAVVNGGRIKNSDGLKNEADVWGQQAHWGQYWGVLDGREAGAFLMPDPRNFRRSWFHARDYGLLVANPFGRNAFTKGNKSRVVVKKGEPFRLRFGVLFYDAPPDKSPEGPAVYQDFLTQIERQ
jgi:hypothetical protein